MVLETLNNGKPNGRDLQFRTATDIRMLIDALTKVEEWYNKTYVASK